MQKKVVDNWYIFLALGTLVFLLYINSLSATFVSDDIPEILNNFNISNFNSIFRIPSNIINNVIRYLAYCLGGLNPLIFRLPNIFFHIGNTIAIFIIINWLTNRKTAIFTSLIFATHPILVESITWISGGVYPAYSFFFLISFIFYILSKEKFAYYWISIVFFLLSLITSEKAIILFLIFPLYEISFGLIKKTWYLTIPYLLTGMISLAYSFRLVLNRVSYLKDYNYIQPEYDNIYIKIPTAITEYLRLILWPSDLSLYRDGFNLSWINLGVRIFVLLSFLTVIYISYKKNRHIFFWLTFFVITLIPTLTPFRIASIVAERYVYLGSIGIFAVIGLLLDKLSDKQKIQKIIYVTFALVILALSVRTIIRNRDWLNEDTLWIASAKVAPNNPNVLNNLGDMYSRHGDLPKAIQSFSLATKVKPDYADAYHNLAVAQTEVYLKTKNNNYLNLAIENYQKAIQYNPVLWQSHKNLGAIYYNLKRYDLAIEEFEKVIEINPQNQEIPQILKQIKK